MLLWRSRDGCSCESTFTDYAGGDMGEHSSHYTTPVTAQFGDRLAHEVSDRDVYERNDRGAMRALCGEWFVPAPMMSPVGKPCPACVSNLDHAAIRRLPNDHRSDHVAWRIIRRFALL
ncbi:hypothetical protein BJF78_00185 [Pseudonocardia sp. CNS-139]|nr:hypothetical protein BJF78_00185 [Pseudonocardia sp. CNS-139]